MEKINYKFEINDQVGNCTNEELDNIENVINKYYKNDFNDFIKYEEELRGKYKELVDDEDEEEIKDFVIEYILDDGKMKICEYDNFENDISYWNEIDNKVFEEFKDLDTIYFNIERY